MVHILREHFFENPEKFRELFKISVKSIEMEISSYCNRRCSFCPNSFVDRISAKYKMDDALFENIVSQLGSINYDGDIKFHRYNEPAHDRPQLISCIRKTKELAPHANIVIFTNGDYLDREYIIDIFNSGCTTLNVNTYLKNDGIYNHDEMIKKMEKRMKKWGFPFFFNKNENGRQHAIVKYNDDVKFNVSGTDLYKIDQESGNILAMDRGGSIDINKNYKRFSPCLSPFIEMQIEFDGTLVPCCNIRSDVEVHKPYSLGKLTSSSNIFQEWCSASYVSWRRSLIRWGEKTHPCASCDQGILEDTPGNRASIQGIIDKFLV